MTAAGGDPARSAAAAVVAAPAASAGAAATPTAGAAAAAGPTAGAAAAAPTAGAAAAAGPTAGAAAAAGPTAAAADCPVFLSLHNHPAFTEDLLSHRFYGVDAPTRPPRVELVSKKFHLRPCGIPSARGSDHFGLFNHQRADSTVTHGVTLFFSFSFYIPDLVTEIDHDSPYANERRCPGHSEGPLQTQDSSHCVENNRP